MLLKIFKKILAICNIPFGPPFSIPPYYPTNASKPNFQQNSGTLLVHGQSQHNTTVWFMYTPLSFKDQQSKSVTNDFLL